MGKAHRQRIFIGTDITSRIGGWRGTALAALFHPPSSEPDVLVSKHPARQIPLLALWPLRITRRRSRFERFPCRPSSCTELSSVPRQVVTPAVTQATPSPWGLRLAGDPMFRHGETCERNVGASHTTFLRPHWSPSFPRGYPGWLLCPEYSKALAPSVLPEDVYFHPLWLRFRQCCSHPLARNEASLKLQRFRFLPALPACCCS